MIRKKHSPKEKTRIVLEALRGENTINEIAARNNINPSLLTKWKTQAIQHLPDIFEQNSAITHQQESEKEKDELYKQIGKLTTQVEWLKKKAGY
jgi:transposase-like protein